LPSIHLHPVAVAQYESGQAPATLAAMHRIDMVLSRPGLNLANGKALRDRYRAAGFSRASLARALSVSQGWVADFERGERSIGPYAMQLIDTAIAAGLAPLADEVSHEPPAVS
jgi:hypothetical protein